MVDRIIELMRQRNLTPSQFADEIGIQRSGMSHLLSGRNKPSLEFIMKVLKRFPDVKADQLLFGTSPSSEEAAMEGFSAEPELQGSPVEPTLFDHQDLHVPEIREKRESERHGTNTPLRIEQEPGGTKIEKIVVFYTDRTFREYRPD